MGKVILQTLLGLVLGAAGVALGYFYVNGLSQGSSPLLLIASVILAGGGGYFLYRAGNGNLNPSKALENAPSAVASEPGRLIERNSKLVSEWAKTTEAEAKLKMLKMRAEEEEK